MPVVTVDSKIVAMPPQACPTTIDGHALPLVDNMAPFSDPCSDRNHNNSGSSGGLTFALQALLTRHESYIADSEAERNVLTAKIDDLSSSNAQLQSANEAIVAENRELLAKLETLNANLGQSGTTIKGLESTLADAQLEVHRMTVLAARAAELESQLIDLETSRATIAAELEHRTESEKSTLGRWREAEGRIQEIARDLERIEREGAVERERYTEIMARMERDKMLGNAEGRLKGAAALAGLTQNGDKAPNGVVSHFVRDILMDNANLQAGVVELRELLQTSNEEVQGLREQVMLHQPLDDGQYDIQLPSLEEQIAMSQPRQSLSQEVHVHHHYHTKVSAKKDRASISARRHGKKRSSVGFIGSTSDSSVPSTPLVRPQRHISTPLASSLPATQQATPRKKRWSVQSSNTAISALSSLPSSPRSYFDQTSSVSIFDRIEQDEISRPTSPESADGPFTESESAFTFPKQSKAPDTTEVPLGESVQTDQGRKVIEQEFIDDTGLPATSPEVLGSDSTQSPATDKHNGYDSDLDSGIFSTESREPFGLPQPSGLQTLHEDVGEEPSISLRRSSSHDSLMSISGMDIHLAKRQPSQLFPIKRTLHASLINGRSPTGTISASQPIAGLVDVTASSNKRSFGNNDASQSRAMLTGLAGVTPSKTSAENVVFPTGGIGKLVGGWVRGRWGIAPMKSSGDLRTQATDPLNPFAGRTPGINQAGSIPGLRRPVRTPSEIHAKVLDEGLLQESLAE